MNDSSWAAMCLPVLVSIPTSLLFRYVVQGLTGARVSWRTVISMNVAAMILVLYNVHQRRLVSLREIPGWVWVVTLAAILLLVVFDVAVVHG